MKILGIIAEYNPFHNGHLYHLQKSMELSQASGSVCVMSGNFMQRGEPAMAEKWTRAKMATNNGVNLVLELPFVYACNSAEYFAKGAVNILNSLGCITHISFGSESGNLDNLKKVAEVLVFESKKYQAALKGFLSEGCSYPKARQEALQGILGSELCEIINSPNNILAVEYLKQLIITDSKMVPLTIHRVGDPYMESNLKSNFASARAIRQILTNKAVSNEELLGRISDFVPGETKKVFEELLLDSHRKGLRVNEEGGVSNFKIPVTLEDFHDIIKYKLLTMEEAELSSIFSVGEGLENRFKKVLYGKNRECGKQGSENKVEALVKEVVSKRYTETRIQRILIHILLNFTKEYLQKADNCEPYARILAADSKGLEILSKIKKSKIEGMHLIDNMTQNMKSLSSENTAMLKMDSKASDIYHLISGISPYEGSDFTKRIYIRKD